MAREPAPLCPTGLAISFYFGVCEFQDAVQA